MYLHEYGHYLQSQSQGLGYLFRSALPSLFDAMGDKPHKYHDVEMDANNRALKYFMEHVDGFNVKNKETGEYPNGQWNGYYHPTSKPLDGKLSPSEVLILNGYGRHPIGGGN